MTEDINHLVRPQKRRRVLVACSNCRARKTKCDAKKPICSTCVAAGEECNYAAEGVHANTRVLVDKEFARPEVTLVVVTEEANQK